MKYLALTGVYVLMCASLQGQSERSSTFPDGDTSRSLEARIEQMPDSSSYQVLTRLKNPDVLPYTDNVLVAVQRKWYDLTSRAERAPGATFGTTVVDFKIGRDGSVSDTKLVESCGAKDLD